jgi:hypothetical protein
VETPPVTTALARRPKRRLKSLQDLDRRTANAKAALALRNSIVADLGGEACLSAMKRAIIDNVAVLGAALDNIAYRYLAGEPVELIKFATLANAQRRLLSDLGLERKAVEVHQHLSSYLASKRDQQDSPEDDDPVESDP